MKPLFTVVLLLLAATIVGQSVEKFYTYNWKECQPGEARFYSTITNSDSGYIRKDYFIHEKSLRMSGKFKDPDTKVSNGLFYYYHPNGSLEAEGRFVENKKSGIWLHYYSNGMLKDSGNYVDGNIVGTSLSWYSNGYPKDSSVIDSDGKGVIVSWFDNGYISSAGYVTNTTRREGIWKFYHKNRQTSSIETYKNDVLTDKKYFDESGNPINDTTSRDTDAAFPGGVKNWQNYLKKKIYFPDQLKLVNSDKAEVIVTFVVNEEGKTEDVEILTPLHPDFDNITRKAIEKSPNWLPSIKHNRKVKAWMRQVVTILRNN